MTYSSTERGPCRIALILHSAVVPGSGSENMAVNLDSKCTQLRNGGGLLGSIRWRRRHSIALDAHGPAVPPFISDNASAVLVSLVPYWVGAPWKTRWRPKRKGSEP